MCLNVYIQTCIYIYIHLNRLSYILITVALNNENCTKLIVNCSIYTTCVLSLEPDIGREDEFWVSGGSEFQSRGQLTEKALLLSDNRTYGMERTSESEDLVETECDRNERLL